MRREQSSIKFLAERRLLIDADIDRVPEFAGVLVVYGVKNDPVYVKSVSNLRAALLKVKRQYRSAIEFAVGGQECADDESRIQLEKVLMTAFGLREKRDNEVVTHEVSSI
jgi:hypothetical protein